MGDELHHDDGTHRTTAWSTNGQDLPEFDRKIRVHLAEHQTVEALLDEMVACIGAVADILGDWNVSSEMKEVATIMLGTADAYRGFVHTALVTERARKLGEYLAGNG